MLSVSYSFLLFYSVLLIQKLLFFKFVYFMIYYVLFIVCLYNVFPVIFYVYNCNNSGYDCIVKLWFISCFPYMGEYCYGQCYNKFLVLGGSDNADIVNICCNGVYPFLVRFLYFWKWFQFFLFLLHSIWRLFIFSVFSYNLHFGDFTCF